MLTPKQKTVCGNLLCLMKHDKAIPLHIALSHHGCPKFELAYNEESRKKGRRTKETPIPVQAARPIFFGDFVQSCGDLSLYRNEGAYCSDSSTSIDCSASSASAGCLGIRIGDTNTTSTKANNKDLTAVVFKAMNTLSVKEREQAYKDICTVCQQWYKKRLN
jgi:hypothetical protein